MGNAGCVSPRLAFPSFLLLCHNSQHDFQPNIIVKCKKPVQSVLSLSPLILKQACLFLAKLITLHKCTLLTLFRHYSHSKLCNSSTLFIYAGLKGQFDASYNQSTGILTPHTQLSITQHFNTNIYTPSTKTKLAVSESMLLGSTYCHLSLSEKE